MSPGQIGGIVGGLLGGLALLGLVGFFLFRLRARRRAAYMGGGISFEPYTYSPRSPPIVPDSPHFSVEDAISGGNGGAPEMAAYGAPTMPVSYAPPVLPPIAREPLRMAYPAGTSRSELFPSMLSTSSGRSSGMVLSPAESDSEGASAARPSLRDTIMSRTTAASVVEPLPGHASFSADAMLADPFADPVPAVRPPAPASVGVQNPFADPNPVAEAHRVSLVPPSPLPLPGHTRLSVASTADILVSCATLVCSYVISDELFTQPGEAM